MLPPDGQYDGATLLQEVRDWLARFISPMTPADLDLLTLWAAHTHLVKECYTTPRLQIDSPVPESGKTTVLEHLQRLCLKPELMAMITSSALLTRMLEKEQRTLLIDEVDRALRPDKEMTPDLLAVINSGYKRGATRPVLVQVKGGNWEPRSMPTFAAVAMAGNDPNLPDDTRSRIIRVLLLPDAGGIEDSNWEEIELYALHLGQQLASWADQVREQVAKERPALPSGIVGRFREKWSPLKRVAVAAGGRWPAAVDAMALRDLEEHQMDKQDGLLRVPPAVLLLHHLHELWPEGEFWPTVDLCAALVKWYPANWGKGERFDRDLTPQRLGRMLAKSYKINSHDPPVRGGPRGYRRSDFLRAWRQMGIPTPATSEASATDATSADSALVSRVAEASEVTGVGSVNGCGGRWKDCANSNCRTFARCVK